MKEKRTLPENRMIYCEIAQCNVWIVYEYIAGKIKRRCLWPFANWRDQEETCLSCINYRP